MMKPLILDYAIERKGNVDPVYKYDCSKSLNTIKLNGEKIAFINSDSKDISLLTKTKVKRESDDEDINVLEINTKTRVKRERDDIESSLLELETKTFVKQEQDDDESIDFYQ